MQCERYWLNARPTTSTLSAAEVANGRKAGKAGGAAYRDPEIPGR